MTVSFDPSEPFLLQRYVSLSYFGLMRDHFADCVSAAESALDQILMSLPRDYRNRPVHAQPDIAWGAVVIPNMTSVLAGLNEAYIRVSHGQLGFLASAGGLSTVFVSIMRDYDTRWMPGLYLERFEQGRRESWRIASNIDRSCQCIWAPGDLSWDYNEEARGPLDAPPSWPVYRPNPQVRVKTGDKIVVSGVYLPAEAGCAQFLIAGQEALGALPPDDPNDLRTTDERAIPTTWTLVEKIADSGGGIPGASDPWLAGIRERCVAGEACPRTGWWTTPAAPARRRFVAGTVMPELGGDWGTTVWQLDQPD
ncbi:MULTISPECIES: hypothetical protein [unclassified Rubrivivax]|uniref:hypothetical protein n=1 Tax=unclassified Rubrivivax TaxID=2649762 RepID=UPI001E43E4D2|nr:MULTISPECIES: hypothetical protein [unclassified Rubrivivax]MCC9595408.1 hypothetical protein [Rubrivivax sp. JA1055]MCC9647085.1 hypothetical protein [Rubrivivax sp. JA1029]